MSSSTNTPPLPSPHHHHHQPQTESTDSTTTTTTTIPAYLVETHNILTTTMNDIPGHRVVRVLGTIYGITVRTRNIGVGFMAAAKSVVGGEITQMTGLMYTCRNRAVERLVGECMQRGGNAVIALRFDQGELAGMAQICAYGTACVIEKI